MFSHKHTTLLHTEVSLALFQLANKKHLIEFIKALSADPTLQGDDVQVDPRGREYHIKVLGRHALFYFVDPYAQQTRLLTLERLEN
ncbi:hypothetical protein [Persicirhabdus sediminis]|uniref:Uncharacterized protein n=1 Tax=Persicirhabdus sediminis TaxID=454144 RepID=A0A8J7SJ81_9BACT|nr:hypothetical protein [Persicirhabdus sediminis]MBK1790015.1 hypothetical protein [Persicirhabdus sediminis]